MLVALRNSRESDLSGTTKDFAKLRETGSSWFMLTRPNTTYHDLARMRMLMSFINLIALTRPGRGANRNSDVHQMHRADTREPQGLGIKRCEIYSLNGNQFSYLNSSPAKSPSSTLFAYYFQC